MYIQELSRLQSEKTKRRQRIRQLHEVESSVKCLTIKTQSDIALLMSVKSVIKDLAGLQVKNRQRKNAVVETMRKKVDVKFFGRKVQKMNPSEHGKKALFQRYLFAKSKTKFFENEEKRIQIGTSSYSSLSPSAKRQVRKERNYLQALKEAHLSAV